MIAVAALLPALWVAVPSPLVPERAPLIYQSDLPLSEDLQRSIRSWASWRPVEATQVGLQLSRCPAASRWTCAARSAAAAPYLLVIETQGAELRLSLLNVGSALARYENREGPSDPTVEEAITRADLQVVVGQAADLLALLSRLFTAVQGALERSGHWAPNGDLRIEAPAGLEVLADQELLGVTTGPITTFEGLRVGVHQVALRDPKGRVQDLGEALGIQQGRTTSYTATLVSGPNLAPQARTFTFFTGVVLSLTGAGLMTWVALSPPDRTVLGVCPSGECPSGLGGFRRSSELGGGDTPSGPLVLPLGYSLLGAGVGMSVGSVALGDDWTWPWAAWLIGLGTFGLSYGLSEAFGG